MPIVLTNISLTLSIVYYVEEIKKESCPRYAPKAPSKTQLRAAKDNATNITRKENYTYVEAHPRYHKLNATRSSREPYSKYGDDVNSP